MSELPNICYDARMIGHSGIGTQVFNVLKLFTRQADLQLRLLGQRDQIQSLVSAFKGEITDFAAPIYGLSEQITFPSINPAEILHCPHYNAAIKHLKRSVVVVHDLIHLQSSEFAGPHYRAYAWLMLWLISHWARHIVCVSDTTRLELIKRFPAAAGKTSVIYNGINHKLFKKQNPSALRNFKKRYNLPARYLLCVGIGKRHKNVDFVLRSLAPLWKKGQLKYPLVLAGTGGYLPDYIADVVESHQIQQYLITMPYLEEEELPLLYGAAFLFIYPSLLEGFGFPLVEAMACACPVLASQASCLPEIGADAALYFDPQDPVAFSTLLLKTIKSETRRTKMIAEGRKRSRDFSWDKHIQQLLELYRSLA